MKNSINKVINFLRYVVAQVPNNTATDIPYLIKYRTDGKALFFDMRRRISVHVGVSDIIINQYSLTDNDELINTTTILWDELSVRQKSEIIDIMDDIENPNESDERSEIIERIFNDY